METNRMRTPTARAHPRTPYLALLLCAGFGAAGCRGANPPAAPADAAGGAVTNTLAAGAPGDAAASGAPTSATPAAAPTEAVETLTAEDEASMVTLIRSLFGAVVREQDPDMQDVTVRQMTTTALRTMRGLATPDAGAFGFSSGYVWVIGFKTKIPLTLSTFSAENKPELIDVSDTASLAGTDGRTSVYYVLATTNVEGTRRFVPLQQGILVDGKTKWTLDDLAKLPATR